MKSPQGCPEQREMMSEYGPLNLLMDKLKFAHDQNAALQARITKLREALRLAKNYADENYREGDKGYQFSIYCGEALAEDSSFERSEKQEKE